MKYSKEFIEKVKRAFPASLTIQELAETGNGFLGRYLSDSQPNASSMPLVTAVLKGEFEEAREIAERMELKYTLYRDWQKELEINK